MTVQLAAPPEKAGANLHVMARSGASDGASFATGTYFPIDGGYLAR